jgi:hypothetical protein
MNPRQGLLQFVSQEEYKTNHWCVPHINWTLPHNYWITTPAYSYYPLYVIQGEPSRMQPTWNEGYSNEYVPDCKWNAYPQQYLQGMKPNLDKIPPVEANNENDPFIKETSKNDWQDRKIGNTSPCSGVAQPLMDIGQTSEEPGTSAIFEECSNCSTSSSSFRSSVEEMRNTSDHHHAEENVEQNAPSSSHSKKEASSSHNDEATDEERNFYQSLYALMSERGQPIMRLPTLGFKELDLFRLFKEVTSRGGVDYVIAKKQWKEVADALGLPSSCTDSGFRLRLHYVRYLEPYERKYFTPPPDVINSLFKYRGRKLGNLYRNQGTKYTTTNRKKAKSSSSESTECKESSNVSSPTKRRKRIEKKEEETKQQLNNISNTSSQIRLDQDSQRSSRGYDETSCCNENNSSLRLFDRIGEYSLRRYIHRYLDKRDEEIMNIPRESLIHMVERHFHTIQLSPLEETETLLKFLQVVSFDRKLSRDNG